MSASEHAGRHLGLDLGGTNIKWVVAELHGSAWRVLDRGDVATKAADGPEAVVARLAAVAASAIAASPGTSTVGIGVPGLYDPQAGRTRFLPNLAGDWNGVPVARSVGEAVGLPAHLVNDARAFGLAELRLGAGRGASTMIGLTLGTGVGGVIALNGRVHQGRDGTAGEIGHQTIDPDGPRCGCGSRGCLEAFTRGDQIAAACGTRTAGEAVSRARNGDGRALSGLAEIGRYLGIGIASMVTILTPERVVIGGGISAATDLLVPTIRAELERRVRTTSLEGIEILRAELGTWAGAIGAAVHGAEAAEAAAVRSDIPVPVGP